MIGPRILPGEGINVIIIKLCVARKQLIIVDAPVVILVKVRRQGKVVGQVKNSGLEAFGAELGGYLGS